MSELHEELVVVAERLSEFYEKTVEALEPTVRALYDSAMSVDRASSGSWLGYQARVYYESFLVPPPGKEFDKRRVLAGPYQNLIAALDNNGPPNDKGWRGFSDLQVEEQIRALAGEANFDDTWAAEASRAFEESRAEALSILAVALGERGDGLLVELRDEIARSSIVSREEIVLLSTPSGNELTGEEKAMKGGVYVPYHRELLFDIEHMKKCVSSCDVLARLVKRAGTHLERVTRRILQPAWKSAKGTRVFIGHGRSPGWRELKDFIEDRLGLSIEEFNRVPVAGTSNKERLSEMLDASAMAFLIFTGEDDHADGRAHARMNVVHEAGLFQGRHGFNRAIILLEEGCEKFSNLDGLVYISFPKGRISAAFEEIRRVVEREGLVTATSGATA